MANFDDAVDFVLENEGSYVDNPADSGGCTNFGISLRFLREVPAERLKKYGIFGEVTCHDVQALTLDQAKLIYHDEFWIAAPFGKIANQAIANFVFDMCVQHGIGQGIKLLQRAIWAVQKKKGYVVDDGILGENTLNAILQSQSILFMTLPSERAGLVRLICAERSKDKEFLDGWLNRCYRI